MASSKLIIIAVVINMVTARVITDDPGPGFGYTSSPMDQGEVMMKEAILYLTPSQIKAYEASQRHDQRNQFTDEEILNVEEEIKKQLEQQNIFAINKNERPVLNLPKLPPPVVEEETNEDSFKYIPYQQKWVPVPKEPEEKKFVVPAQKEDYNFYNQKPAESYSYIKFFTGEEVHETPKLQLFHPPPQEHRVDPELAKFLKDQRDQQESDFKLNEYKNVGLPKTEKFKHVNKFTTLDLLEKYKKEQYMGPQDETADISKNEEDEFNQFEKEFSDLNLPTQFDDKSPEAQKFLIKLEKENALARAEALLKAPPTVIRKEVSIKRRPITVRRTNPQRKEWSQRYSLDSKRDSSVHRRIWKQ